MTAVLALALLLQATPGPATAPVEHFTGGSAAISAPTSSGSVGLAGAPAGDALLGGSTADGGSIVDRLLRASGNWSNKLADLLGGKCWPPYSEAVQVRRKAMCMADEASRAQTESYRSARTAALKALGMSIGMVQQKQELRATTNQTIDRMRTFAYRLQAGANKAIIDMTSPVRTFVRPQALVRSQYQLSQTAVLLLSETRANGQAPMWSYDPLGMGLLARSSAVSLALDRVSASVAAQIEARGAAVHGGQDKAAGAARAAAEQQAIAAYNAAVRNAAATQHAQLGAYMALEREKDWFLRNLEYSNPTRGGW